MNKLNTIVVIALALSLPLAGCVESLRDDLESNSAETGDALTVDLRADGSPAALAHLGFVLDGVFAHEADTPMPDGFHEIALQTDQADIVQGNQANSYTIAQGDVPEGEYDQILLRLSSALVHGANAATDDHDHGADGDGHDHDEGTDGHDHDGESGDDHTDGEDGHDHDSTDASGPMAEIAITSDPVDIPVDIDFAVIDGENTRIELVLDAVASTEDGSLKPVFSHVTVEQAGEVTRTAENVVTETQVGASGAVVETAPPVARAAVFAPNGDQIYEPDFLAEDGVFVNSMASAFLVGQDVRFGGTDSEAVEPGATIKSHAWNFGDGTTSQGPTAAHSFQAPGVYEVTLTVTDSAGAQDSQTVRLVIVGWTKTLADTSFEDGAEDWTDTSSSVSINHTFNGEQTRVTGPSLVTWALTGEGFESSTGWQANHHIEGVPEDPGYLPGSSATLTSAEYKIPSTWEIAGMTLALKGETATGGVTVDVTNGENTTRLASLSGEQPWTLIGGERVLDGFIGETVTFEITFTAPDTEQTLPAGTGWYVDALTLAGLPTDDLANAHLLEDAGGHDGHDHSH